MDYSCTSRQPYAGYQPHLKLFYCRFCVHIVMLEKTSPENKIPFENGF